MTSETPEEIYERLARTLRLGRAILGQFAEGYYTQAAEPGEDPPLSGLIADLVRNWGLPPDWAQRTDREALLDRHLDAQLDDLRRLIIDASD